MDSIIQVANGTHQIIIQVSDPNTVGLVIATLIIAGVTFFGILLSNKRTRESNDALKESNRLLRIDILARYRPILQLHNRGIEPLDKPNDTLAHYHPNLRNDGNVEAKHIRIYYKTFQKTIEIIDIVKEEEDIKKHQIPYDASILPNGVAVVNAIDLPVTNNEITVIFWIEYKFLASEEDQIIFNVVFEFMNFKRISHYVSSDIDKAKNDIKIRENGAPL